MSKRRVKSGNSKARTPAQKSSYYPTYGDGFSAVEADLDIPRGKWASVLAYKTDSAVNRASGLVSDAVDAMRWRIMEDADGKDKEIASSDDRLPRHPLAQAAQDVFKEQGQPFLSMLAYSIQLYGAAYVAKTHDQYLQKRGIRCLNPYWTEPQIIGGEIAWFQYGGVNGARFLQIDPQWVAYYHTYNPDDDLRGYSKVDAALDSINRNRYARQFVKFTYQNNARPGALLTPVTSGAGETILSDKEIDDITRNMRDNHRGVRNANMMQISPRPLNVTVFEQPEIDKYYSVVPITEKEVFRTFGVPLAMAGDSSSSTYKDGEEVLKAFYKNTIIPLCRVIAKYINTYLMPWLDPTGRCTFEFDTSPYEDTAETDKLIADMWQVRLAGSYVYLNEARVAQGLEPRPEFDGFVLVGSVPTPVSQLGVPAPVQPQFGMGQSLPLMNQHLLQSGGFAQEDAPPITRAQFTQAKHAPIRGHKNLSANDYCILAPLTNDAAVRTVQDTLRGLITGTVMEWQDPATYHLTFAYASGTLEQINSVALDDGLQTLIVDRVDQFDTPEGWAVHLKVRSTPDLVAYQARLVDAMHEAGMDVSAYSDAWEPHVTLCYTEEPITPFAITPLVLTAKSVEISDSDYKTVRSGALKTHTHKHTPYEFEKPLTPAEWREKALNEVIQWQRHEKAGKTRPFVPVYTAHLLEGIYYPDGEKPIRTAGVTFDILFDLIRYEPFKATIARVDAAFTKSIGDTRQEFEDEFLLAIADTKDGALSTSQLQSALNSVIDRLGEQAYFDGLEDGGIPEAELDEDDRGTITRLKGEAKGYLADFIAKFETYTDIQLDQRPRLWANKSLQPFYDHGLAAADANGIYIWRLGRTETHCDTCLAMNGQRKRMKNWLIDGILPQSDKLDCGGWECDCGLFNIRGGAKR